MFPQVRNRTFSYSGQYNCDVHISTPAVLQFVGKANPVTGRGGPQVCETSKLPNFLDNRLTVGGEVVSFTRQPSFNPGRFLVLISVRS
jgi:hypothetical protein